MYLVRRSDGALYTGIAIDVRQRLVAHAGKRGAKALRGRGPLALVFSARLGDRATAQRLEARLKRLAKVDKERLVACTASARRWFLQAGFRARRIQVHGGAVHGGPVHGGPVHGGPVHKGAMPAAGDDRPALQ